jgi:hypothetical protein
MSISFRTTILKDKDKNATGIQVPAKVITALGSGKKPKVKMTLKGYTYRTTIAVMSDTFMLPLSTENRQAVGVKGGDTLDVALELDTEPRTIEVPDDLSAALSRISGARPKFDALSYSVRKEFVRQVESAKARETRVRRIAGIVSKIGGN